MGNFLPLWSPYIVVGGLLVVNAIAQVFVLHQPNSSIPVYVKEANEPTRPSRASRASRDLGKFSEHRVDHSPAPYLQRSTEAHSERPTGVERHTHADRPTEVRVSSTINEVVSVMTLLQDRKILLVVTVAVTGNACIGMVEPLVPLYLHNAFGEDLLHQGLIFATATGTYLLCTPIAGMLSDSLPKWSCLCVGLAALSFGLGMFYISTGVFRVCVSMFFVGAGMSFIDTPSLPLLSEIIEVRTFCC